MDSASISEMAGAPGVSVQDVAAVAGATLAIPTDVPTMRLAP